MTMNITHLRDTAEERSTVIFLGFLKQNAKKDNIKKKFLNFRQTSKIQNK